MVSLKRSWRGTLLIFFAIASVALHGQTCAPASTCCASGVYNIIASSPAYNGNTAAMNFTLVATAPAGCSLTSGPFPTHFAGALIDFGDGYTVTASYSSLSSNTTSYVVSHTYTLPNVCGPAIYTISSCLATEGSVASCLYTQTISIAHPAPFFSITNSSSACNAFSFNYSGGGVALQNAQWSYGDGSVSSIITNTTITSSAHTYTAPGTYTVYLTGLGIAPCTVSTAVTVSTFPTSDFSYTVTNSCNPSTGVTLSIQNYSTSPIAYDWLVNGNHVTSTSQTSVVTTFWQPGTNTVSLVTSNSSCSTTVTHTLNMGAGSLFTITIGTPTCNAVTLNYASGLLTNAQWAFGDGALSSVFTNTNLTGSIVHTYPGAGSYVVSLSGTGIDPCTVHTVVTVSEFTQPDFTYTVVDVCLPYSGIILAIPNYTTLNYQWQINGLFVTCTGASATYFAGLVNGINTIKLNISNSAGCNASVTKYVSIGSPQASFTALSPVCVGDVLSVYGVPAGGTTYSWQVAGSTPPMTGMNPYYTFSTTGTFAVTNTITTVIGTSTCMSNTSQNVSVYAHPDASFTLSPLSCNNAVTITLNTPSTPYTSYSISYGDGSSYTGASSISSAHLSHTYSANGYYTVDVQLFNGPCSSEDSKNVNINNNTSLVVNGNSYLCPGSNVQINSVLLNTAPGAGPFTYSWTGPSSFTSTQATITVSAGGMYSLTVTSTGSCALTLSGTKSITALAQPAGTLIATANISCTNTTGSATLAIPAALQQQGFYVNGVLTAANSGASSPLNYTLGGLAQGNNYITIANGLSQSCSTVIPVSISQSEPSMNLTVTQPEDCSPGVGSATVVMSPSNGTVSWYPLATYPGTPMTIGLSIALVPPGSYVVENVYGNCITTQNFSIVQPVISVSKSGGAGTCGSATAPVTLNAQFSPSSISGTFNYTLKRFVLPSSFTTVGGPATTNTYSIGTGNYSITVTSAGCTGTYTFAVNPLSPITINFNTVAPSCHDPGSISAIVSGGDGNYTYKWYKDNTLTSTNTPVYSLATLTAQANFSLQVNDQSGCAAAQPTAPIVAAPVSQVSLAACSGTNTQGTLNAASISSCGIAACVQGGKPGYTFEWYNNATQTTFTEWHFMFFSGTFVAVNGADTMTVTVPTSTANLNLGYNTDYDINTLSYPYWDFSGSPRPVMNSAGTASLGATATSTNSDYYYTVAETTTASVLSLAGSCSGPSGTNMSATNFENGSYTLCVTDANGCRYCFSMGTLTFTPATDVPMAFSYVWGINKTEIPDTYNADLSEDMIEASHELKDAADKCMAGKQKALKGFLTNTCFNPATFKDNLQLSYTLDEHHHTLYYYDRAGRLTKTVPPQGVDYLNSTEIAQVIANRSGSLTPTTWPAQSHSMATTYEYNSFGQLISQKTPDGGVTNFIYDGKNRLRFSQNDRQKNASTQLCSYTKYDQLGRIVEVGETPVGGALVFTNPNFAQQGQNLAQADYSLFPTVSNGNKQITTTVYSSVTAVTYYGKPQRYVQNRVSYTVIDPDPTVSGDEHYTHYSYDSHGNVEWLVQDDAGGMGKNFISYSYDLVSGKVLQVSYNDKRNDRFYHRYVYDSENRLVRTETSRNGSIWDKDAAYSYYAHGPLRRAVIGEDHVQGMDYLYTIHGWIKAMNSPALSTAQDPGDDNDHAISPVIERVAADRFGMVLKYYDNDYIAGNLNFLMTNTQYSLTATQVSSLAPSLYNGNISGWVQSQLNSMATGTAPARADLFQYDLLNRIRSSASKEENSGAWQNIASSVSTFSTNYQYDRNGNILTLQRYDNAGAAMDDLSYTYDNGSGGVAWNANRLTSVSDANSTLVGGRTDLQATHNYTYDETGNLTRETGQENMTFGTSAPALYSFTTTIKWNVYGKIQQINKTIFRSPDYLNERITFRYDAIGNRTMKDYWKDDITAPDNVEQQQEITTTFYVRDAQGNVMSTYSRFYDVNDNLYKIQLTEQPIYGSDRVGQNVAKITMASASSFANLTMPANGAATISEYQNWITTTSKTELLPNGQTNDNLCQCRLVSLSNSGSSPNYNNVQNAVQLLGIANNGIAVAEDLNRNLQFYAVVTKKYLGANNVCLVFDKTGKLMQGTDLIGSVDTAVKPVIVNISGSDKYALITLDATRLPRYHIIDMTQAGYGPVGNMGVVTSANNSLAVSLGTAGTHGYHFTGVEDHINAHSIVYGSRFTLDPYDNTKGTTDIMAYDFGSSTVAPTAYTVYSQYGCGGTEAGQLQISPDGSKLAWWQYDKTIGGFTYRSGQIHDIPLSATRLASAGVVTVQPISAAGNYGNGMLEYMKNSSNILYAQRGIYKENTNSFNKYSRNVWNYDPVNLTLLSINPNTSPLISYLFGEIKRGVDGNYYVPQMGKAMDQIHSYDGTTWNSDISVTDTSYKLASSLPTQVFKIFDNSPATQSDFVRLIGGKDYELKDHLGNVRVVISDTKLIDDADANGLITSSDDVTPEIRNYTDYYAFGMAMPGRVYNGGEYRYSYNGKERDDEVRGSGNFIDFGARSYDPRIGRWMCVDPKRNLLPGIGSYAFAYNNPIIFDDPDGQLGRLKIQRNADGGGTITLETTIHLYGPSASQQMADDLNKGVAKLGTTRTFVDKDGKTWVVKIKVHYVYNQQLNNAKAVLGSKPDQIVQVGELTEKERQSSGIEEGDNILKIDDKLNLNNEGVSEPKGGGGVIGITHGSQFKVIFHESGHLIGFGERWAPIAFTGGYYPYSDPNFVGDPMVAYNDPAKGWNILHFYNVMQKALERLGKESSFQETGFIPFDQGANFNTKTKDFESSKSINDAKNAEVKERHDAKKRQSN